MEGYGWLNIFKCLWIDVTLSSNLLMQSQDRFSDINPTEAFKLIAIELSFLYDILYTKAVHIHCTLGRILRCFSLVSILAALVVFQLLDRQKYASKDIIITYILFGAGLGLEVIATVLLVFSDWTIISLNRREGCKCFANAIIAMVNVTSRNGKPRWSRTIGQYNIIDLFLRDRNTVFAWIMTKLKIKDKWDNMWVTRSVPVTELLEDIIFTEAIRRAQNVHTYYVLVEARSYRGSKALEYHGQLQNLEWSMKREFDECIILWHVATDICYYTDIRSNTNNFGSDKLDVSWQVSNYMVYLLIQQPSMMQLGYGMTRFEATRALLKNLSEVKKRLRRKGMNHEKARHEMLRADQEAVTESVDDSRSDMGELVVKDCRRLAEELQKIKPEIKWQLISETWVEMLIYAAIHCDASQHAKSLSRGGELLTHLWLLMAQLGVLEEHMIQNFQYEIV